MEEANEGAMASPIRELRRLYRDAEAKAARLRLIVDVRSMLDRSPWETSVHEALSAIAGFAGANMASIHLQTGENWQYGAGSSPPTADTAEMRFIGTAWMGTEQLELALSRSAFPIHEDDRKTIQVVTDQLAGSLAAERQHAVREQLTINLQARERELARLVEAMIGAQEQERRRIAYDLHDGVAQSLVSLLFHLEAVGVAMDDADTARRAIESGIEIARSSIRDVRGAIAALRPAELDDLGLEAALRARLDSIANMDVQFRSDLNGRRLAGPLEVTFYRVAQEALANATKHSGCSRIDLRIALESPQSVCLTVTDNGRGITVAPAFNNQEGGGVGLSAMRERMALIGGSLIIHSAPGTGTVVVAQAPIPNPMKELS
jgi:signal transduction histidine kinase